MLSVGLFGVFRISHGHLRPWCELGSAGRALASYLFTFPDRPHRRERLADLFWPALDADRGRGALNSALWRVRKTLQVAGGTGYELRTGGTDVLLETCDWLDIDAHTLESAAALVLASPAPIDDSLVLDRVLATLGRYQGPFLDGDEGDWILEERERLHSIFIRTAIKLVHQLGAGRRYSSAIELASFALKEDPYREELFRYLLGLLVLNEQRARAINRYKEWSTSLLGELGIAPLPATKALFEDIRKLQSDDDFSSLHKKLFS